MAIPGVTTDRDVILRSLREPEVFGELFERHARPIHRFLSRRTTDAMADDVVAETFLRAFERRDRFSPTREDALPWLFGIAMNVLRQRQRGELRFVPEDLDRVDDVDAVSAAGRRIDAERRLHTVMRAVQRMSPPMQDTLLLHVWAGLGLTDVAAALQVPIGTVHSRLNRARAILHALPPTDATDGALHGRDAATA